jgi:GcrA cell cycle regulator
MTLSSNLASIAPSLPIPSTHLPVTAIATNATAPIAPAPIAATPKSIAISSSTWTAQRIEQLRSCVAAGMTCSEIAAEIGVTRNAVIGKIHRLGLSSGRPAGAPARASTSCPPRARHPRVPTQRRLLRLAYAQASLGEQATSNVSVASAHPRSLVEIAERQCRWPIGDPAAADFVFCGNDAIMGFTDCLGHARMAYRAPASRRG